MILLQIKLVQFLFQTLIPFLLFPYIFPSILFTCIFRREEKGIVSFKIDPVGFLRFRWKKGSQKYTEYPRAVGRHPVDYFENIIAKREEKGSEDREPLLEEKGQTPLRKCFSTFYWITRYTFVLYPLCQTQ